MPPLEPDRDQLEIFIDAIFRRATPGGFVSLRSFVEGQNKPLITATAFHGDRKFKFLADRAETYARTAAQAAEPVVFCPPLALFNNRKTAREEDIEEALALSVECDQRPRQAREKLEELLGTATVVVTSGGIWLNGGALEDKLHLHWRLANPARGEKALAKLKELRRLATKLVGADDSNVPACHPIRWPGSWHRKAEPRLCTIETASPDVEIDLDAALAALQAAAPPEQPRPQENGTGKTTDGGGWDTLIADIVSGKSYHGPLDRLAAKAVASGMKDGATVGLLRGIMTASTAPHDGRWQTRFDDVPRDVRTARTKFDQPEPPPTTVFDPWQQYIVPDFPVAILPPIARDFVCKQSEIIGCDVAGLAMSVLATFSGALHHGFGLRMLRNGSWWASPRLWVLLVGPVSAKKTPTFDAATEPLLKYEYRLREKYAQELRDFEKAKEDGDDSWPEPEKPPRYAVWDTTVEKLGETLAHNDTKGILVKSDELAAWLSSMERYSNTSGRSDRAFWLKAYDGGPYGVDRVKRGDFFIKNLSVSVIGGIQPDLLAKIREELTTDGLLQRFLPTMLRSSTFRVDRPCPDEDYVKLVCALLFAPPQRLIMTDAALVAMTELHKHLFDLEQASSGLAAGFDSFVGKLAGICGTLALILHLAHDPKDGATRQVGERTIQDVRTLMVDFIIPHAVEFYRAGSAGDRLRRIASWILISGATRLLASDLTAKVRDCRGMSLVDLNKSVAPLVAAGWLKGADNSPVCKSWEVEPLVHLKLADRARIEKERRAALAKLIRRRGGG